MSYIVIVIAACAVSYPWGEVASYTVQNMFQVHSCNNDVIQIDNCGYYTHINRLVLDTSSCSYLIELLTIIILKSILSQQLALLKFTPHPSISYNLPW